MTDFVFPQEHRFPRLTLARAETLNTRFGEVAAASATKLDKAGGSVVGDLMITGNFTVTGTGSFGGALDMNGYRVINAGDAIEAQDLVTRAQLTATAFDTALPSQSGNAGKFVTTDGTNAGWVTISFGTIRPFSVKTGDFNAVVFARYRCNTAAGAIIATLPASPSDGELITMRRKGANNLTAARNGKTIAGLASDLVIDTDKTEIDLTYNATTGDWEVVARAYA